METVDLNKLGVAIKYVERMADGRNPVNNMPVEDAVLNNPNVIRCMFFVKEVLEKVRSNGGIIGKRHSASAASNKEPFPFEILKEFKYQSDKSIAHLLKQIHGMAENHNFRRIAPQTITNWLKKEEYLTVAYCQEVGKESAIPTDKGKALGMYTEVRTYNNKTYLAVIYNRDAQEFIVNNLQTIVNG